MNETRQTRACLSERFLRGLEGSLQRPSAPSRKRKENTWGLARINKIVRAVFVSSVFLFPSKVYACPSCKELLTRGQDAFKMMKFGEGIAWSMVLFFGMPPILIGSVAFMIYRSSKKAKQKMVEK